MQWQCLDGDTFYLAQPIGFFRFEQRFQFAQVVTAEFDPVGESHAACGSLSLVIECAAVFQEQAMAQYAEQGFRHQRAFIGTDTFGLEEIAQHGVGRMLHFQCGTQGLDDQVETVFS